MAQDIQSLKREIVLALDFLSPDSVRLLAKFVSFLRVNVAPAEISKINEIIEVELPSLSVRMPSPRLVHRHQAADFQKQIVEIEPDDNVQFN